MNPLCRLAARLYPAWWRRRYGREFEALLEDIDADWRSVLDLTTGALTMRMQTVAVIPIVSTLAGAIIGGAVAASTPTLYASSARFHVGATRDPGDGPDAHRFLASIDKALAESGGSRRGTSVQVLRDRQSQDTLLTLTYLDRDPRQAQRVAATLSAAIASEARRRGAVADVLAVPSHPASPIATQYLTHIASGAGLGFLAGGAGLLMLRRRRRQDASQL